MSIKVFAVLVGAAIFCAIFMFIAMKDERLKRRILKTRLKRSIAEDEGDTNRANYLRRLEEYLYEELERIMDTRIDCPIKAVCAA